MRFVVAMALREMRASWKRLLFFFICLSIGVAAIVAIRSVIQSVRGVFAGEARALISADAIISSNREFDPQVTATIDRRLSKAGASSHQAIEVATMVRSADGPASATRMVELRAVERGSFVCNLGSGRGYSVLEVIEVTRVLTGSAIPVEARPRRPGDPAVLVADNAAAMRQLDWRPCRSELHAIIESAWRWRRDHPDGYQD